MRPAKALALASLALLAVSGFAQDKPATADALISAAKEKAKAEGKNVLVLFKASWCSWCKKLDAMMEREEFKPFFEDNFVPVRITVLERAEQVKNENPGGQDIMVWLGGKDQGLPYFGILNAEGKQIATSLRKPEGANKGGNIGYPVAPEEIAHFVLMLQKGAPKATAEQIEAVRAFLATPAK